MPGGGDAALPSSARPPTRMLLFVFELAIAFRRINLRRPHRGCRGVLRKDETGTSEHLQAIWNMTRLASAFRLRRDKGYPPTCGRFTKPRAQAQPVASSSRGPPTASRAAYRFDGTASSHVSHVPFRALLRRVACWKRLCRFLPGPPAHIRASARHLGQARRSPIVNTPERLTVPGDGHRAKPIAPVGRAVSARLPKSDRRDPGHRWRHRRRANSQGRAPEGYGRLIIRLG
jgi:hypothetical protein